MTLRAVVRASEHQRRRLSEYAERGDHDGLVEALRRIEDLGQLDIPELLLKGRSVQLMSCEKGRGLDEAEAAFLEVLQRDPDNPEANLELGWYYYAVEDDPQRALPFFESARRVLQRHLSEAEEGIAKCQSELSRT